ncbi:hypothetical protein [Desulfocurvus vexinensis]|uniref:hypothetical protein n=1 Tax=Desulfocurvus vexinensis TaxID=399548 RepID=UPI00048E621E|nr:hypothetical protein [Desulfocurvus vexinensis]
MDIAALTQTAARVAQAADAAQAATPAAPLAPPAPGAVAEFQAAMQGPQDVAPAAAPATGADATIASLLGQADLGHADLFRIQVAACMASFEAQRNTSVISAMNQGLGTLVKSSE